jgi:hypothetical protein
LALLALSPFIYLTLTKVRDDVAQFRRAQPTAAPSVDEVAAPFVDAQVRGWQQRRWVQKIGPDEIQVFGYVWRHLPLDKKREMADLLASYCRHHNIGNPVIRDNITGEILARDGKVILPK